MTNQTQTLWHSFIERQSTHNQAIQNQLIAASESNIVVDLSHRGCLKLSGDDTYSFLQGQVTNDVKLLDDAHSQFAGYCNAKGRLLALFFAFAIKGEIYLEFDQALLESIMKRLKMYVMRSKVLITDESQLVRIGVAGAASQQRLISLLASVPEQPHDLTHHDDITVIRLPSPKPMFEIITTAEKAIALWEALLDTHTAVAKTAWDWLEIQAGIPEIVLKTQEAFVPQMINLDALGGINYKKGCYTGQEIIARTHYLGKVKRRTQLAHIASVNTPEAGDEIIDNNQQVVGQIVRASPALTNGFDVLTECRLDNLEEGDLFWHDHVLKIRSLPYTLEEK